MKTYVKYLLASVFCGVFQSVFYLNTIDSIYLSDVVIVFSFSMAEVVIGGIIDMSLRLFPFFLFQILFGTYIYRHFCSASVFYFSRRSNRVTWFLKESLTLYLFSLLHPFILVMSGTMVAGIRNQVVFDKVSIIVFIYYLLIHSLWLFLTVLLVNILAIKFDSNPAFTVVAGIQLTLALLIFIWNKLVPFEDPGNLGKITMFLKWNPLAHLVMTWHGSRIESVSRRINVNQWDIALDLNQSLITFLIFGIVVTVIGCVVVKEKELMNENKEIGGA